MKELDIFHAYVYVALSAIVTLLIIISVNIIVPIKHIDGVRGDVNCDGKVTTTDIVIIRRVLAGVDEYPVCS